MKRCGPQGAEKHTITFSFIQRGAQVGRTWCLHRGIELLWANCANTVENRFFFVRMDTQEQRFLKLKRKIKVSQSQICKVFITPPPPKKKCWHWIKWTDTARKYDADFFSGDELKHVHYCCNKKHDYVISLTQKIIFIYGMYTVVIPKLFSAHPMHWTHTVT